MGQKVHPIAFRLGVIQSWSSNWFSERKGFSKLLLSDIRVRDRIKDELAKAGLAKVLIERPAKSLVVTVHAAKPGVIIGKKGEDIESLQARLAELAGVPVRIKVVEIRKPDLEPQLLADGIASQLERRALFRRTMKRAMQSAMRSGAQGIKVAVSGRLNGAEIARTEWYREGRVPLHTLRADVGYATAEAKTTYGVIGIKVWLFQGELIGEQAAAKLRGGFSAQASGVGKPRSVSTERGK